jgi:hypothetical protein
VADELSANGLDDGLPGDGLSANGLDAEPDLGGELGGDGLDGAPDGLVGADKL